MKKFLFALLLAASPAFAQPQPSFLQGIHNCVEMTVAYTKFAQMAVDAQDEDQPAFIAYIQQQADANPRVKDEIVHLGEQAWKQRHDGHLHADALKLYDSCYSKLGTHA